jgi:DDHD domain
LISKKMAEVKPHPLPYTKGGLREQLVGLSGVGQRISTGASNLWSSVRSSITSSLISRSLGYPDVPAENNPQANPRPEEITSPGGVSVMPEGTLYSVFKQTSSGIKTAKQEADKLKAINATGRVDFVIQVCLAMKI